MAWVSLVLLAAVGSVLLLRAGGRGGGQHGERRTSECPARDVIGMVVLELGKRVRWTWGVQAPAAWVVHDESVCIVFFFWCWEMCFRSRIWRRDGKGSDSLERMTHED